jgi:hypothetical protein
LFKRDSVDAPNNGNNCSVLDPNCKPMGPVQKYIGFLTCEAGITIHDIGDADPASTVSIIAGGVGVKQMLTVLNGTQKVVRRAGLARGIPGINMIAATVDSFMLLNESIKANQACTAAIYGH